jgi:hypothetical protein
LGSRGRCRCCRSRGIFSFSVSVHCLRCVHPAPWATWTRRPLSVFCKYRTRVKTAQDFISMQAVTPTQANHTWAL